MVEIDLDGASAAMALEMVEIPDDHDLCSSLTGVFPPGFPQPALVSFDVEWEGLIERGKVTNEMQDFTGQFILTGATIDWSVEQPGFCFESEAPNPAANVYSVIGHERNGVFAH
jgi:hypothetical protein